MKSRQGAGCLAAGALAIALACLVVTALAASLVATGEIPQGAPRLVVVGPPEQVLNQPLMALSFAFDQPMDRDSVESALTIQPPLTGSFRWNEDRSEVTFEPDPPGYGLGMTYTVRLAPGIRAGTMPRQTRDGAVQRFSFPALLDSAQPERGEQGLGPWTRLSASFNYTLSCHSTLRTFSISPHIDGLLECRGASLGFNPGQPLEPSTTYAAGVEQVYLPGESWARPGVRWTFQTAEALSVVEVSPRGSGYLVDLWTPVEMVFNRSVVTDSVSSRFTLVGGGGVAVLGRLLWNENGSAFAFQPERPLIPGREYRFVLQPGVYDELGFLLADSVESEFVTLHMMGLPLPLPGSRNVPLDSAIRLPFTRPMDRASVEAGFTLDPPVEGEAAWLEDTLVFTPSHGLAPETVYRVRVDGNVRDATAARMAKERRWAFETGLLLLEADVPEGVISDLNRPLALHFALPMDQASVQASLTVTPTVPGEAWWTGDRTMHFRPVPAWLPGTEYEISLGGAAQSAGGHHTLGQDVTWVFSTHQANALPGN